ncbi:hypothetical protein H4K36_00400 [Streptomyces sp. DHE7-1]|nr:hypothetical protein [Streptomyces sp. DHE7-1]
MAHAATETPQGRVAATQTVSAGDIAQARTLVTDLNRAGVSAKLVGQGSSAAVEVGGITAKGGKLSVLIAALKRLGPAAWRSVINAAKWAARHGRTVAEKVKQFKKWVNGLAWYNPIKWVLKGTPDQLLWELISYIIHHF